MKRLQIDVSPVALTMSTGMALAPPLQHRVLWSKKRTRFTDLCLLGSRSGADHIQVPIPISVMMVFTDAPVQKKWKVWNCRTLTVAAADFSGDCGKNLGGPIDKSTGKSVQFTSIRGEVS